MEMKNVIKGPFLNPKFRASQPGPSGQFLDVGVAIPGQSAEQTESGPAVPSRAMQSGHLCSAGIQLQ